jgi:D-alanyl-D-alanine carboxypeptidase
MRTVLPMVRVVALSALLLALAPSQASAQSADAPFRASAVPLPPAMKAQLTRGGFWHRGCPVGLSELRLLTVTHRGFDRRAHTGRLVVNRSATAALTGAFRRLYARGFPIRHMRFADFYGPRRERPADGDVTASFECREAVPSPCTGGDASGSWSMHAYGLAIDLNPRENPYVGCGQSRDPAARSYRDRSDRRPGMVGWGAVRAFAAVGWGWGGAWSGDTKDYMHFSANGR